MAEKISSIQGEFVIEFAKSPDGAPLVPNQGSFVYLNGEGMSQLNVPKVWTHVFQSASRQTYLVLNAYVNENPDPRVWIRYGVISGGQGKMTDWEPHTIVSIHASPSRTADSGHGDLVTMVTADLLYVMQKTSRVASRKGRISSMARAIAESAGFEKFAIEPTDLDYALVQSFESDYNFLVSRLIQMASNKESTSNYLLFARGEFFHFHTLKYQLSGYYQFDYGIDTNTSTSLTLENNGNKNSILRISGIKLVAHDPLTGVTTNWETKPEREIVLSDQAPERSGTQYARGHVGQNQLASMYAESQWRYTIDKTEAYEMQFTVDNYPYVSVGDVISSAVLRGQGDPWEGFYLVKSAKHTIVNARVLSRYVLVRGEYASLSGGNVGGKKLSAPGIEASSLTAETSGGFHLGKGSVVEVNSPNRY